MAHVFQTFDQKTGKAYARWRYQYTDYLGKRRRETGTTSRTATQKIAARAQDYHDSIRKGWRPKPKTFDAPKDYNTEMENYLSWGAEKGGRRGFGWSPSLVYQKRWALNFWKEKLSLNMAQDLNDCLPRVDAVLIQIAKNKTGKTVNHYAAHLKAFARHLVDRGLLESDPLKSWKKKDETPTHPHRLLTPEEIHKLLNTAPAKRRLLYRVALATGYRQAELRALTVAGLDPFGPSLKLSAPFTKNRRDARQFITQDLFAELTAASAGKKPDEPLLSVPEKSGCGENFQRDIRKAGLARASQHGKATFHSLRVCFIQAVVESGADVKAIMEAARHSSAQMSLETYAKPNVENIRQASTTAANSLLNQIESPNLAPQKAAVAGSDYETMAYAESEFGSNPGGGAIYSSVSQSLPATATFRWASVGTISRKTASAASKAAALIRPQLRSWKRQAPHSP